jgi:hypothetical protein
MGRIAEIVEIVRNVFQAVFSSRNRNLKQFQHVREIEDEDLLLSPPDFSGGSSW